MSGSKAPFPIPSRAKGWTPPWFVIGPGDECVPVLWTMLTDTDAASVRAYNATTLALLHETALPLAVNPSGEELYTHALPVLPDGSTIAPNYAHSSGSHAATAVDFLRVFKDGTTAAVSTGDTYVAGEFLGGYYRADHLFVCVQKHSGFLRLYKFNASLALVTSAEIAGDLAFHTGGFRPGPTGLGVLWDNSGVTVRTIAESDLSVVSTAALGTYLTTAGYPLGQYCEGAVTIGSDVFLDLLTYDGDSAEVRVLLRVNSVLEPQAHVEYAGPEAFGIDYGTIGVAGGEVVLAYQDYVATREWHLLRFNSSLVQQGATVTVATPAGVSWAQPWGPIVGVDGVAFVGMLVTKFIGDVTASAVAVWDVGAGTVSFGSFANVLAGAEDQGNISPAALAECAPILVV